MIFYKNIHRKPEICRYEELRMEIEIWNDFCVPHCYTGETLLLRALEEMGVKDLVSIRLGAFELDPSFPKNRTIDVPQCVARKYGCSIPEALEKIAAASNLARAAGIDMKFITAVFCNTRNAHRLLKFAYAKYGSETALKLNFALFAAYFTQNLVLDDANLVKIAESVGMDARLCEDVLNTGEYETEVIADEREASERGIYAIPYFDFGGKFSIGGSMPLDGFKDAIRKMMAMNGDKI